MTGAGDLIETPAASVNQTFSTDLLLKHRQIWYLMFMWTGEETPKFED